MSDFAAILAAANGLPVDDRLRLIDALSASVPDDRPPTLSPEWVAEIERRSAEIDSGDAVPIPWEEVRTDLFRKAAVNREG